MKRFSLAASTVGLALLLNLGLGAAPGASADSRVHAQDPIAVVVDDPMPVECPFCGGDPMLHVRRMNDIAVLSSRLAYQLLDASLF